MSLARLRLAAQRRSTSVSSGSSSAATPQPGQPAPAGQPAGQPRQHAGPCPA